MHHVAHHVHVALEVVARAEGEACGDQAVLELGALAHADAAFVQEGATALGGSEQVVAGGVVNHRLLDLALDGERNAHAVHGEAVDEVGGAVQRVDHPDEIGMLGAVLLARLFSQDAVAWVGCEQGFDDDFFSRMIHFGHKVVDLLLRNAHGFHVKGRAVDDGAGGACSLDGHVEHGVQIGRHKLWWLARLSGALVA